MRLGFPVAQRTDRDLGRLRQELEDTVFAPARRQRSAVSLHELHQTLVARIAPDGIMQFQSTYISTPLGYLVDKDLAQRVESERKVVRRARHRILRIWRRHTLLERLTPRISCLLCDHPMMGGYNGRSGYVCPRCNYVPFYTVFYACECGHGVDLIRQPNLDGVSLFAQAIETTRDTDRSCPGCGRVVDARRIGTRLFVLAIPWPLQGSVDARLMAMREEIGKGKRFVSIDEARGQLVQSRGSSMKELASLTAEMPRWARGTWWWLAINAVGVVALLCMVISSL